MQMCIAQCLDLVKPGKEIKYDACKFSHKSGKGSKKYFVSFLIL